MAEVSKAKFHSLMSAYTRFETTGKGEREATKVIDTLKLSETPMPNALLKEWRSNGRLKFRMTVFKASPKDVFSPVKCEVFN